MVTYRIRLADVSDADVIAGHRVAMFREMGEIEHPDDIAALVSATRHRLIEQIASGEYLGWLAEDGSTVVGGAGVLIHQYYPSPQNLRGRPTAYVLNVYTDPAHRKQGVASRLMETITQWCVEQDIPRVSLHTSDEGRRLYEQLGFLPSNEMWIAVRLPGA
jgi:GNAT superfamily N-acetyltransferase